MLYFPIIENIFKRNYKIYINIFYIQKATGTKLYRNDTHVNHPWLRLRSRLLQTVTSSRRSSSRSCSRSPRTSHFITNPKSEERKVLTHTLTLLPLALSSIDFTAQSQQRVGENKIKGKNVQKIEKTVTVLVDKS